MIQNQKMSPPAIGEAQIERLERLCNANAVSGAEGPVRKIVMDALRDHVDDVRTDAMGNLLITRKGQGQDRLRVMVAAHMDEVGFMITYDDGNGLFRFDKIGGINDAQLAGKTVLVGRDELPGVIGIKPIHLTNAGESKKNIGVENLRIDVGPNQGGKVQQGDRVVFASEFMRLGPSLRTKALDDRLGVASLIELVLHAPDHIDLLAAFTVQEEVGLRGARVAAYTLDPDLAIVLDCTPANDLPLWDDEGGQLENTRYNSRLDFGPAIYTVDARTISDPRLIEFLAQTAETEGIPYQFRQPGGGGTDAGAIHIQRAGIPSVSISVPGRYLHTAASLCRLADWENTLALAYAALHRLSREILISER